MTEYIYFIQDNYRNEFFDKLKEFSGFSWKEMINAIKISRASLERYRNGKIKIPINIFNKFITYFPGKFRDYF